MFGGINPRQMQGMMKKMGIAQEEIDAEKVIIEKKDGTKTIISNPSVMKIKMQGQTSYQISGDETESNLEFEVTDEDIETIVEKTGKNKKEALETLKRTKDLAEAIIELS